MADVALSYPNKNFEEVKKINKHNIEFWTARELMPLLGYKNWRDFENVIKRAELSCSNSGQKINYHFAHTLKMIKIATGTEKETIRNIEDYILSRYACYLIAQNGDSSKKEISLAQTYFALQTRKQEIFERLDSKGKRLFLRGDIKTHNKKLFATAQKAGVTNFAHFNNQGYLGLYGMNISKIKEEKRIGKDDILDRAGSTELAANLFRITQTDEKIKKENIEGGGKATYTHWLVGHKVRKSIQDIGGTPPEKLPPEEHIKVLEKEQKKLLKQSSPKVLESK